MPASEKKDSNHQINNSNTGWRGHSAPSAPGPRGHSQAVSEAPKAGISTSGKIFQPDPGPDSDPGPRAHALDEFGHAERTAPLHEVGAEVREEQEFALVLSGLVEFCLGFRIAHLDAAHRQAPSELRKIHPPIIALVCLIEEPEELVKVKQVGQECLKVLLHDEVPRSPGHAERGLVGPHEGWFVVEEGVLLNDPLVCFRQ
mmetsp:Transcript_93501/g.204744  ORF Transcript_93501/g.204744 Transcript_93501/m.204744 type:complete len:201 (-) Transcript_93501:1518-2120(-)